MKELAPRFSATSCMSPDTSSEKRVQRQQRMQRSRSSLISGLIGTGLAKVSLGSVMRVTPGP
jgi:hypothetical protein